LVLAGEIFVEKIKKDSIFLIDGSSFLYRAYYAMRPLHTAKGEPTQAVYGFCRAIKKLIDDFDPKKMVLVWDSKGKTFRNDIFEAYKATRQAPPSDLIDQKQRIIEFAEIIGLPQVAETGYEADDLIASIAVENKKNPVVVVTPDKDLHQLINDHVVVFDPFKRIVLDEEAFTEAHNFEPQNLLLYHALVGDASDNIPGVKGVGKKTAQELTEKFKTLDNLYKNLDKVEKDRVRRLLEEGKDSAKLSLELFTLQPHKLGLSQEELEYNKDKWADAYDFFNELELTTLLRGISIRGIPKKEEKLVEVVKQLSITDVGEEKPPTKKIVAKEPKKKEEVAKFEAVLIRDEASLKDLITSLKKTKFFAFDTETTGVKPLQDGLVGISFAFDKKKAFYIPFAHTTGEEQLDREYVLEQLKPIFESKKFKKALQNTKFDQLALWHYGVDTLGIEFDTLLAADLLRKGPHKIGLKSLSMLYLDERMLSFAEVMTRKYKTFDEVPIELATRYSGHDSLQTYKLKLIFEKLLDKEPKLKKIFKDIEMPLSQVLFRMERVGIKLDVKVVEKLEKEVSKELQKIEGKILASIEKDYPKDKAINLNSPKQVEKLLFDVLKLTAGKKSSEGRRSTDQSVLEELSKVHPIPGLILKYRELFKLKSTYLDPLPKQVNPETGRIHTTFGQTGVATGRLASYRPNLQNIPVASDFGIKIRSAFVSDRGKRFLSADYSQIDLRVLAHVTKDKNLMKAFKEGKDIHKQTAAQIFGVKENKVTSAQRKVGKRINFSIIYGLTPFGLSKDLDIKPSEAKLYIEKYFEQYPGVAKWMEKVVEKAKEDGYVETVFGRRRYVPELHEKNRIVYEAARRVAVNTPIQGTSAEIIKMAMIEIDKKLDGKIFHKLHAKMILQIHDELIFELSRDEEEKVEKMVKKCMEKIVKWDVPLIVDTRTGKNWEKISK